MQGFSLLHLKVTLWLLFTVTLIWSTVSEAEPAAMDKSIDGTHIKTHTTRTSLGFTNTLAQPRSKKIDSEYTSSCF